MSYKWNGDIRYLSSAFYLAYPPAEYPEILEKQNRPYSCLMLSGQHFFICIPFRSSIQHRSAFFFRSSQRSRRSRSGLDYTKMVLVRDPGYIGGAAVVDRDEYLEALRNLFRITAGAEQYIRTYIGHVSGGAVLHKREYARRYACSTLPYFHDILGLP